MHELASKLNLSSDAEEAKSLRDKLLGGGWLLGLLTRSVTDFFMQDASMAGAEIDRLIEERAAAKASKRYDRADEIRAELLANGIAIEDTRDGTVWKVVKT